MYVQQKEKEKKEKKRLQILIMNIITIPPSIQYGLSVMPLLFVGLPLVGIAVVVIITVVVSSSIVVVSIAVSVVVGSIVDVGVPVVLGITAVVLCITVVVSGSMVVVPGRVVEIVLDAVESDCMEVDSFIGVVDDGSLVINSVVSGSDGVVVHVSDGVVVRCGLPVDVIPVVVGTTVVEGTHVVPSLVADTVVLSNNVVSSVTVVVVVSIRSGRGLVSNLVVVVSLCVLLSPMTSHDSVDRMTFFTSFEPMLWVIVRISSPSHVAAESVVVMGITVAEGTHVVPSLVKETVMLSNNVLVSSMTVFVSMCSAWGLVSNLVVVVSSCVILSPTTSRDSVDGKTFSTSFEPMLWVVVGISSSSPSHVVPDSGVAVET